jgi:hypothetical protein
MENQSLQLEKKGIYMNSRMEQYMRENGSGKIEMDMVFKDGN